MDITKIKSPCKPGRPDKESLACKTRGREATMDRLLKAGIEVFATHGFDAATTKLIAQEAGINESLINRYFDGKEGLLVAIIRTYVECERTQGPFENYPRGETVAEELRHFFKAMHEHHLKRRELTRIFMSRAMIDTKVRDELKKFSEKGAPPILIQRLKDHQDKGLIRSDVDVAKAAAVIGNAAFSMIFINHIVMGTDAEFIKEAMSAFAEQYARGLSGALEL